MFSKIIRNMLDRFEPLFKPGGKFEKLYPLYEANDSFLFTPGETTKGGTHIRDALDLKRMMTMVIVALLPCIFMALYNTGFQAQKILYADSSFVASGWRYSVMDLLGIDYHANRGEFLSYSSIIPCCVHGALFFLPVYLVTMVVGGICEVIFSVIRKHEINEGFLVTGMLFPLTLPPTIPLWQVALGIAFGVVLGKEIFGGTGRNFLNPALTARAFLYFAHAKFISGDACWTAVDGYTGATALGQIAAAKTGTISEIVAGLPGLAAGTTWWDCFWGNMHGSMGETSVFCCALGALILIATRIGSWRIMAGVMIGMSVFSGFLCMVPGLPINHMTPWWHLVLGGFAFGTVFMATDPVSGSMTDTGKWVYGGLIGFMTVFVRVLNPAFPEGIMLAILFSNCFAPIIDYVVVQANIRRRMARYV